jgi:HSP20 family protein
VGRARNTQNFRQFQTEKSVVRRKPYPYKYRCPKLDERKRMREPEPLIDVLEEEDGIRVVAEFVGFSTKNLKVHAKEQKLILSAENSDRKYYKSLNLPKRVIPKALRTTYKNGVLEILLKKAVEERAINKIVG